MTAPGTLFDLPLVQDAVDYALKQLSAWQLVPQRVNRAQSEVQRLASAAGAAGDMGTVAQLTAVKQSLDGVSREYADAGPLVAEAVDAARVLQEGGTVSGAAITDAAKLATVMAANLAVLAQDERVVRDLGGNLTVGPSGGVYLPAWAKWGVIGLGVWWFLRRVL